MQRRVIDPWNWLGKFGIVAANEVSAPSRTLFCSGLADIDARAMGRLDMKSQLMAVLDQIETLLGEADMGLEDVVRLNIYTIDIDALMAVYGEFAARLQARGAKVAGCMLGVARLGAPDVLLEIEATAVK